MDSNLNLLVLLARYIPSNFDTYCAELQAQADVSVRDLVETLKQVIDQQWAIDPKISLELSNIIIGIGMIREQPGIVALGMMARGDSIRMLGSFQEAWDTLHLAGKLYLLAGDEVGWGRTRIGRMGTSPSVNKVDIAERESRIARNIFERCGEYERALRLDINMGYMYQQIGQYRKALKISQRALQTAEMMEDGGHFYRLRLYTNIGYSYTELGDLRQALKYHEMAYALTVEKQETAFGALAQNNIAFIAILQGRYRDALSRLHAVEHMTADGLPIERNMAQRLIVKCYLNLNRYGEARALAHPVIKACRESNSRYESGYTLIDLAMAEAELGNFEAARTALDEAEATFTYSGAMTWVANVRLRRGQIALKQGDLETALVEAQAAAAHFEANNEQVTYAHAVLLAAQAAFAKGEGEIPAYIARTVLSIALRARVPWLRYSIHLLLGRVAEAKLHTRAAIRRYSAAARTVERVQQGLTITLRPGFLENKEDALRGLMKLYLESGQAACAFETLERAKSQAVLNHLANRENLRWLRQDKRSQTLIEELENLRIDHHGYYQLAFDASRKKDGEVNKTSQEEARLKLSHAEARMRAITEQLYLQNKDTHTAAIYPPQVHEIQAQIGDNDALVAFYHDSQSMWAFVLDQSDIRVERLPMTRRTFDNTLRQFQFDIACALKICAHKGPHSAEANVLTATTCHWLKTFYDGLLAPIADYLKDRRRLTIVPYGLLHYLPFHLLHTGEHYLIEDSEMVVLPSAGLLTVPAVKRPGGAAVFGHSNGGQLPATAAEAQIVRGILNGDLYLEDDARRKHLPTEPQQVLHIAAHGHYRLDQPDLSYIELADGQLYTDDLLQHDLSYELVTLSACETGRVKAVSGDELVGIGRGFLYAGAGALITSLWRIDDQLTVQMMEHLYRQLQNGASKAAALRDAQRKLLDENSSLHPAFWGAFQLIGNADPLSSISH